jgi:p-aminobenzoyl-glutamate transporter AbgT
MLNYDTHFSSFHQLFEVLIDNLGNTSPNIKIYFVLCIFIFMFCGAGDQTQGLDDARQASTKELHSGLLLYV